MKYSWLFLFPLLFLPNLGLEQNTIFGTLAISDFLIWPYLITVYLASRNKGQLYVHRLIPLMIGFVWWASISTLLINLRYYYASNYFLLFGLLKIAKFSLYGLAAVLTIKALADEDVQPWFKWSFLTAGCLVGISLFITRMDVRPWMSSSEAIEKAYKDNSISALMSIFICYVIGLLLIRKHDSLSWRWIASGGLIIMLSGFFLSKGRGGWIAALVGVSYLLYKVGLIRALFVGLAGLGLVLIAYNQLPEFQKQMDKTLWPDSELQEIYGSGIIGYDEGGRLRYWTKEAVKLIDTPILGTGFFHRAGLTRLDRVGSHNFFIQIFLETGVVGGAIILMILSKMWQHTNTVQASIKGVDIPLKAVLLTAFVVGMSGEYFYGGLAVFTLFVIYGVIGANRLPQNTQQAQLPQALFSK